MIDLIQAYIDQLPNQTSNSYAMHDVHIELTNHSNGNKEEVIEARLGSIIESYIGRPYNSDTVVELTSTLNRAMRTMGLEGTTVVERDWRGELDVRVDIDHQRSPGAYMSSVGTGNREIGKDTSESQINGNTSLSEDVIDLIAVYNDRQREKEKPRLRMHIESVDDVLIMEESRNIMGEYVQRASEAIARSLDQQALGFLNRPIYYTEFGMQTMPLTHREVLPFDLSIEREVVPVYAMGRQVAVYNAPSRYINTTLENVRGILSTGMYSVRPRNMNDSYHIRMGRDGMLYMYDVMHDRYERFENEEEYEYSSCTLIEIDETRRWFGMELVNPLEPVRIVDVN